MHGRPVGSGHAGVYVRGHSVVDVHRGVATWQGRHTGWDLEDSDVRSRDKACMHARGVTVHRRMATVRSDGLHVHALMGRRAMVGRRAVVGGHVHRRQHMVTAERDVITSVRWRVAISLSVVTTVCWRVVASVCGRAVTSVCWSVVTSVCWRVDAVRLGWAGWRGSRTELARIETQGAHSNHRHCNGLRRKGRPNKRWLEGRDGTK